MCEAPQYSMRVQDALQRYGIRSPSTLSLRASKLGIQAKKIDNIAWYTIVDILILDAYNAFLNKSKKLPRVGIREFKKTKEYKEIVSLGKRAFSLNESEDPWLDSDNDSNSGDYHRSRAQLQNKINVLEEQLKLAQKEIDLLNKQKQALVNYGNSLASKLKGQEHCD